MSEELLSSITDEELLSRLGNTEDSFVERKRFSDDRQWTRTAVAFANSCPIGYPGILFIGVYDTGLLETPKSPINLDSLQKTLAERLADAWPPLYFLPKVRRKDGQEFLGVLVPGSPQRPHFAGHSYIRVGCETRKASESQFDNLILQRTSSARELLRMIGQQVFWLMISRSGAESGNGELVDVNQFFITIDGGTNKRCWPLDWVTISFEPTNSRPFLYINLP
jgi:Schlafen, AlbA_2